MNMLKKILLIAIALLLVTAVAALRYSYYPAPLSPDVNASEVAPDELLGLSMLFHEKIDEIYHR